MLRSCRVVSVVIKLPVRPVALAKVDLAERIARRYEFCILSVL